MGNDADDHQRARTSSTGARTDGFNLDPKAELGLVTDSLSRISPLTLTGRRKSSVDDSAVPAAPHHMFDRHPWLFSASAGLHASLSLKRLCA